MDRLGIYVIYDKDGIIDEYVIDVLRKIKTDLKEIIVVCNGKYSIKELDKITGFANEIYVRDNKGYDAGAFKDAVINYIGKTKLMQFDELLLFNDSFYSITTSFSNVFFSMESKNVDFWSLTKNTGNINIAPSIQSYFLVIRKEMLNSKFFYEYWETLPYYKNFNDVVNGFEKGFASYFERKGFVWDSYIDMQKYEFDDGAKDAFSPYHSVQYEIMVEQEYPVIKRKLFAIGENTPDFGLNRQTRENFLLALESIKQDPNVDMENIWKNVLRTYSLRDIQINCGLTYILNDFWIDNLHNAKCVLFILLEDNNSKEKINRIMELSKYMEIYLFSYLENSCLENCNRVHFNRINEKIDFTRYILKNYAEIIKKHNFFGVLKEHNTVPEFDKLYTVEASHNWGDWENLLGRNGYLNQLLNLFMKEKRLGLLVTPLPLHGKYIKSHIYEWNEDDELNVLLQKLGITDFVKRSLKKAYWSTSFWCRVDAIGKKFWKNLDDISDSGDYFAQVFPYIIQKNGYYTGVAKTIRYARMKETIQDVLISDLMSLYGKKIEYSDFYDLKRIEKLYSLNNDRIENFLKYNNKVYIYGAGEQANIMAKIVDEDKIKGFIVTNSKGNPCKINGKQVFALKDVSFSKDDGVVLGLNRGNTKEVLPILLNYVDKEKILEMRYED